MKPFLLIQSRPEDSTSDDEYRAFLQYCGLDQTQLQRHRIEQAPLPSIDLREYSGILTGGSPFNFTDGQKSPIQQRVEHEMHELLDMVVEFDMPFFGACYGVGLLASHQGGSLSSTYAETVGAYEIHVENSDPLFDGVPDTFTALLGHKEACEVIPPTATLLASSETCPVQMFRIKTNIYATQFHPELDGVGLETRIRAYQHHGYFKPEDADSLIALGHSQPITEPMKLLANFVRRYSRA